MAIGLTLAEAVILVCILSTLHTWVSSFFLKQYMPWGLVLRGALVRIVALYVGVQGLALISNMPMDRVKQMIGLLLLGVVFFKLFFRAEPHKKLWPGWSYLAFITSGLMAGAFGIGGPPLVIWAASTDWPQEKIRAFLLGTTSLSLPVMLVFVYFKFPHETVPMLEKSLYIVPFVVLGVFIGLWLARRFSIVTFRRLTFIFLGLLAISLIVRPWLI